MYKEMQLTSEEMNNGVSELDALHNFAQRCSVKEIRKFSLHPVTEHPKGRLGADHEPALYE